MPLSTSAQPQRPADSFGQRAGRRRALISLTPLIDVVFILLVFFMLASSFLDWRAIDLTAPARASAAGKMEGALLVEIRPDGLRLAGEVLPAPELLERVEARMAEKPGQTVLVRPADGVALQDTIRLLDGLADAGVTDLSLIRERKR